MEPIKSIETLAKELDGAPKSEQSKIVKRLDLSKDEIAKHATWCDTDYTRNCLARTEDYELILLCWDAAAQTPIHGHGGQDCWVYQVDGTVEEIRFQEDEEGNLYETHQMELNPGGLSYMHDRMGYHMIKNPLKQRAMTLHIYAKPIDACKVFDPKNDKFKVAEMEYDTVVDEVDI